MEILRWSRRFGSKLSAVLVVWMLATPTILWSGAGNPVIFGVVSDNELAPLEGVTVELFVPGTENLVASAATDAGGSYSIKVPAGTYDLHYTPVPNSGFREVSLPDVEVLDDLEQDVVLVPLELAEIDFVLQDRDGMPAANQDFRFTHSETNVSVIQRTDDEGAISLVLRVGTYAVRVTRPNSNAGAAQIPRTYRLDGSLEITGDLNEVLTLPNVFADVTVVDPLDQPVPDATVDNPGCDGSFELFPGLAVTATGVRSAAGTTDAEGRATLTLFPCQTPLRATPPVETSLPQIAPEGFDVFEDSAFTLEIPPPVFFTGVLQDRDANPALDDRVHLTLGLLSTARRTDVDTGDFSLPMQPGAYQVRVQNGSETADEVAELPGLNLRTLGNLDLMTSVEQDITLPNVFLDLTVTDSSSNAVPDAEVAAQCLQRVAFDLLPGLPIDPLRSAITDERTTDALGQAQIRHLICHNVRLTVTPSEATGLPRQIFEGIELLSDASFTAVLDTPSALSGSLRDRFDIPVPEQRYRVFLEPEDILIFDGFMAANSTFSTDLVPDTYNLQVRSSGADPGASMIPDTFVVQTVMTLDLSTNLSLDLQLPGRILDITVVDPNGTPIPETSIRVRSALNTSNNLTTRFEIAPGIEVSGSNTGEETTDANGFARIVLLPHEGTFSLRVTPPNGSGFASELVSGLTLDDDDTLLVVLQFINQVPIAEAGPAQIVEATSPEGASATLDGSGSSDPDGEPLAFEWEEDGTPLSTQPIDEVMLGLGTHLITLTVRDPDDAFDQDDVEIQVVDTTPPDTLITSAAGEGGLQIPDGGVTRSHSVTFEFIGLDSVDIAGYECSFSGEPFTLCAPPLPFVDLPEAGYFFEVRAFDSAGNVDPTPATFSWTVSDNVPVEIPTLSELSLGVLMGFLMLIGLWLLRTSRPNSKIPCHGEALSDEN